MNKKRIIGSILILIGFLCLFIQDTSLLYAVIGGNISGAGLVLILSSSE